MQLSDKNNLQNTGEEKHLMLIKLIWAMSRENLSLGGTVTR